MTVPPVFLPMRRKLTDCDLVLTYYGDDFTGSTDVLDSLTAHGLPTVLFLQPPTPQDLTRFKGYRAAGVAGASRTRSPEWMDRELPPIFEALKNLGAPVCHYKVCSTFDSSPQTGSIGKAIDIGRRVFGNRRVPLVVGAPALGRYTVFGNLFAASGGAIHRLDRHPTMSRHPVTPMGESDLRLHLGRQTSKKIGLLDIIALHSPSVDRAFDTALAQQPEILLFDILDETSLVQAGRLIWERRESEQIFTAGSSGLEYALVAYWRSSGQLGEPPPVPGPGPADRIAVVSGSCSVITEQQIRWALANGFEGIAVDPVELVTGDAIQAAIQSGLAALAAQRSVVVYTALGPGSIVPNDSSRIPAGDFNAQLGRALGRILSELVVRGAVRRAVACGGDTSSHAAAALRIQGLTMACPIAPGVPLCRAWSADARFDGLEVALKSGQLGGVDYLGCVRAGQSRPA